MYEKNKYNSGNKTGPELYTEETNYMLMIYHQTKEQNHNINLANKCLDDMSNSQMWKRQSEIKTTFKKVLTRNKMIGYV
jgi:hypothetical protein